jgi:hypothetical protein
MEAHSYVCAGHETDQCPIWATYNQRLVSRPRPKATDARGITKPVKVTLRREDKVAKRLLKWIKDSTQPQLNGGCWIGNLSPRARFILPIDHDSHDIIKDTEYTTLTGLNQELLRS